MANIFVKQDKKRIITLWESVYKSPSLGEKVIHWELRKLDDIERW